jgi:hypothetical protein
MPNVADQIKRRGFRSGDFHDTGRGIPRFGRDGGGIFSEDELYPDLAALNGARAFATTT